MLSLLKFKVSRKTFLFVTTLFSTPVRHLSNHFLGKSKSTSRRLCGHGRLSITNPRAEGSPFLKNKTSVFAFTSKRIAKTQGKLIPKTKLVLRVLSKIYVYPPEELACLNTFILSRKTFLFVTALFSTPHLWALSLL